MIELLIYLLIIFVPLFVLGAVFDWWNGRKAKQNKTWIEK